MALRAASRTRRRLLEHRSVSDDAQHPWDRRPGETPLAFETFLRFRDIGPLRSAARFARDDPHGRSSRRWHHEHDWADRACAWDDELHRISDQQRLEAIRTMHDVHQRAGRLILNKALAALARVQPDEIPPYVAGRLLELGARLERDTLIVSVESLQGIETRPAEDPWEIVARELDAIPAD